MTAVNGVDSPPGTVPKPLTRKFQTIDSGYQSRANDSEVKILEEIAKGLNKKSEGAVHLFTEQKPCIPSCEGVIKKFEANFPKIDLQISYNYENYRDRLKSVQGKE